MLRKKNAHKVDAREKVDKLNAKLKGTADVLGGRIFRVPALSDRALGKTPLDRTAK